MRDDLSDVRIKEIASTPSFASMPLSHEIKYMARELLRRREEDKKQGDSQ